MEIGSLFIILAIALLAGIFISRPFSDERALGHHLKHKTALSQAEQRHSALLAERDRLVAALQELDFDNQLGKIPAEDYPSQRAGLVKSSVDVLKALDEFGKNAFQTAGSQPGDPAAALRRLNLPDDDLEAQIAARRARRNGKTAGFCPSCSKPYQKSDHFCSRCGTTLK